MKTYSGVPQVAKPSTFPYFSARLKRTEIGGFERVARKSGRKTREALSKLL
jgi:hypothetical protein